MMPPRASSASCRRCRRCRPGYTGENSCADIHVSPNGLFLYASNRGHNSIAVFAIDSGTGTLRAHSGRGHAGQNAPQLYPRPQRPPAAGGQPELQQRGQLPRRPAVGPAHAHRPEHGGALAHVPAGGRPISRVRQARHSDKEDPDKAFKWIFSDSACRDKLRTGRNAVSQQRPEWRHARKRAIRRGTLPAGLFLPHARILPTPSPASCSFRST